MRKIYVTEAVRNYAGKYELLEIAAQAGMIIDGANWFAKTLYGRDICLFAEDGNVCMITCEEVNENIEVDGYSHRFNGEYTVIGEIAA